MGEHKRRTINVSGTTHKELKALCKAQKKSIVEFIQYGVLYFKQTGIDPEVAQTDSPQKNIRELTKRVEQIKGMIEAPVQDKMKSLFENIMILVRRSESLFNEAPKEATFKTVITRLEEMMEEDQKYHSEQLKAQHNFYTESIEDILKKYDHSNARGNKKLDEMAGIINGLRTEQQNIKTVIETKLGKKIF
jgi:hypothetical protein